MFLKEFGLHSGLIYIQHTFLGSWDLEGNTEVYFTLDHVYNTYLGSWDWRETQWFTLHLTMFQYILILKKLGLEGNTVVYFTSNHVYTYLGSWDRRETHWFTLHPNMFTITT